MYLAKTHAYDVRGTLEASYEGCTHVWRLIIRPLGPTASTPIGVPMCANHLRRRPRAAIPPISGVDGNGARGAGSGVRMRRGEGVPIYC